MNPVVNQRVEFMPWRGASALDDRRAVETGRVPCESPRRKLVDGTAFFMKRDIPYSIHDLIDRVRR
jgi:hypothetical protein